ncbi:MAG: hypothetical protein COB88_04510 [Flavobacteriales bacterium]|nr:MAG: hypothetical protein COB88_04510 [Flavobacteriales bacterium]
MKKLFIVSALFLGYSVAGMSQSTVQSEKISVISKQIGLDSLPVYRFRGLTTGNVYESLPSVAQLHIGEVTGAKAIGDGGLDDIPAGKTIVENERTGLLFLKGK